MASKKVFVVFQSAQHFYEKSDGSGSRSVGVTNESGCGSGRPKNIQILIQNSAISLQNKFYGNMPLCDYSFWNQCTGTILLVLVWLNFSVQSLFLFFIVSIIFNMFCTFRFANQWIAPHFVVQIPHVAGLSSIPRHWRHLFAWAGWPLLELDPDGMTSPDLGMTSPDPWMTSPDMRMMSPNLGMTSQDAGSGPRHLLLSCRGAGFPEREEIQRLIASHKVWISLYYPVAEFINPDFIP